MTWELDACRTLLRRVLRGLVDGPNHNASLPFWDYDKILFICTTTNFQNIGFTCFRGKKSRPIVDDYIPLRHFKLEYMRSNQRKTLLLQRICGIL